MTDILIVEDDPDIAGLMRLQLVHRKGLACTVVEDGDRARDWLLRHRCRLVILDRMLPGISGMQLLRWMRRRQETAAVPVLMVTALGTTRERVYGLRDGADDYLPKPFDPDELLARVEALLRRAERHGGAGSEAEPVARGVDPVLSDDGMAVLVGGVELQLRPMELALLKALMKRPGKVRNREQLLDEVWGVDHFVEPRTVDVTIKRLRQALERQGLKGCVRTVRGVGYCYRPPSSIGSGPEE